MLVFVDTETTGLPVHRSMNALKAEDNWPDIVSVAWIVYDDGKTTSNYYLIKPDGWKIGAGSTKIHGITQAYAEQNGTYLSVALSALKDDLAKATNVVAHNMEFDKNVLFNAYKWRLNENPLHFWPAIDTCTMQRSESELKLKSKYPTTYRPYKPPSLMELFKATFPEKALPEGMHNSLRDVEVLCDIYWARWPDS